MSDKEKKKNLDVVMLALGILFFFFVGERGVVLEKDSYYYIDHPKMLSLIYTTFIYVCQILVEQYLELIMIAQGVLAIFCCIYLTRCLQKEFKLNYIWTLLVYVLTFIPYTYSLPECVSTHMIITEGITFSLFYIWFVCLLQGMLHLSVKKWIFSNVWATVLILIRFQLGMLFGVNILVLGYIIYQTTKNKKKFFLKILGTGIGIVFVIVWFLKTDTGFVFMDNLANLSFGKVFYVADEEDIELFTENEYRTNFSEIIEAIDSEKLRFKYLGSGLYQWVDLKKASSVQIIGNNILNENTSNIREMRKVRQNLIIPLLIDNIGKYILMNILLYPESLMCALFIQKESIYLLCYLITFILFGSAIGICIWRTQKVKRETRLFMVLILLILIVNIILTNLVLFGLQRYLVYTQGLFYIGYFLLLKNLINEKVN